MGKSDVTGKATEFRLASKLIELGHIPFWPMMDIGYDLGIVVKKKFVKLQCKGTVRSENIYLAIGRRGNLNKRLRPYTTKDCDFIIIYLQADDVWYVIPVKKLSVTSIFLSKSSTCKWDRYKNAWGLLGAP